MSKFPSKVITIEAISDKAENRKAAVKSTEGVWYDLWKDFEGEATDEYNQLLFGKNNGPFQKGDSVIISVKEGEWNGKKQYTIKSMFPAQDVTPVEKPVSVAPSASQGESREAFGLRLAIHGMVNGLLAGGKEPSEVSAMIPELFGLEEDIEMRLNRPKGMNEAELKIKKANDTFSDGSPLPEEPLPVIQQNDDVNVDDIPF